MLFSEEKILIKALQEGNEKAYEYLYDTYYKDLVSYCFSLTKRLPLAEDIVQNTLVKLWANRVNITIVSSLKNYLYRSVYNGFATEYGKVKKKEKALVEFRYEVLVDFLDHDPSFFEEKLNQVELAIEQLPNKCKEVFLLNKRQGYRYKEIAGQLNISEKAVEKHVSRALKRIRKVLALSPISILLLIKAVKRCV